MNTRAQVGLIDMQSQPDGDLKWILVYQDHLTKFVQLHPVTSKRAPEIAYQLLDIFSIFGAPSILQSDNVAIDYIFTEGELEKIISGQNGDEQNDPTEDPTIEENDLPDITDAECSVLEFQEETCEEDVSSTEMVTEIPRSPCVCAQRKNKVNGKFKIVKSNLEPEAFKTTKLAREKFPQVNLLKPLYSKIWHQIHYASALHHKAVEKFLKMMKSTESNNDVFTLRLHRPCVDKDSINLNIF